MVELFIQRLALKLGFKSLEGKKKSYLVLSSSYAVNARNANVTNQR